MAEVPMEFYPSQEDLLYEEEILRNPYSLKLWCRYLQARYDAPFRKRSILYERAVKSLPGSYKLWHAYLKERMEAVRGLAPGHPQFESLNNTFERALVTMHKMPRIWMYYLQVLTDQKLLTRTRRTFDRALCALPVTQHERLWELYLKFVRQDGVPIETALRVYRRYLKFDPDHIEDLIDFLLSVGKWQEAAERLADVLNDERFESIHSKTRHQLWLELCDLLRKHAKDVSGLQVEAIIRGGIRHFTDEVGRLWTSLADYYVRRSLFEKARDVYEEGICSVVTVRDFSMIFDAYARFEESTLAVKMNCLDELEKGEEDEVMIEKSENKPKPAKEKLSKKEIEEVEKWRNEAYADFWLNDDNEVDMLLARLESLMERRPELLSSVLLRQNPHNVHEWHKRAKLFKNQPEKQVLTYTQAVKTVDPFKAVGKLHTLWIAFAQLYEANGELTNARVVFEKAVQVEYKSVDDLASVWCAWSEMEMKHKNFNAARELMRRATTEPSMAARRLIKGEGDEVPVQMKLYKSLRLWSTYVDLEEGLGTLESTRKVYDQILSHRIATPQIIMNYAAMLEEKKYFEEAFAVYEKGVHIFKYPHARDIWTTYLTKFVKRHGGKKLERARDLFEQAIEKVPADDAKPIYLQYAKLEEDFGLARRAMEIYDRATKAVSDKEKMSIYEIYIAKAREFYGISRTREIHEQAIESGLPDKDVKTMCLKYAELERNLGEIDRARALFIHASQMADPRSDTEFWSKWNEFEVQHGNEDTFREMLRIKRSVSASFSQMHLIMPEYVMQRDNGRLTLEETVDTLKRAGVPEDEMAALERQIAPVMTPMTMPSSTASAMRHVGFVSAGTQGSGDGGVAGGGGGGGGGGAVVVRRNPDEIELPDDEEGGDVVQKAVPDSLFGELGQKNDGNNNKRESEPIGALERLKRLRRQ